MAHHEFAPEVYHTAIGSHEPVLEISDGDAVSTTTVDARGGDSSGEAVTARGNPQTGPFFVEGAETGDALAVTFDRLTPNRKVGFTGGPIAPNVLDFGYVPRFEEKVVKIEWEIDLEQGVASPMNVSPPLSDLRLPLRPMLGCFGVAPPGGQAISTATSSTHGGNMDYRGFVEGVTIYLPVAVAGALFHLGDGHALQGDGEIVGTGIETSFDVTFSVRLLKGKTIAWPRAENDTHVMTVGNARPLDQCVQHATTEMVRWLQEDFGLDTLTVHALMGQAVEYDIGNVFDPAYTMVCKMSKATLEGMGAKRQ